LDIGVLGYIGIVWPKEHSPEVRSFPSGTPCIYIYMVYIYIYTYIHTYLVCVLVTYKLILLCFYIYILMTACNHVAQRKSRRRKNRYVLLRSLFSIRCSHTFSIFSQRPWVQAQDLPNLHFVVLIKIGYFTFYIFWNDYKKLTFAQFKSILYWFC